MRSWHGLTGEGSIAAHIAEMGDKNGVAFQGRLPVDSMSGHCLALAVNLSCQLFQSQADKTDGWGSEIGPIDHYQN
jgi:hypothetical protein